MWSHSGRQAPVGQRADLTPALAELAARVPLIEVRRGEGEGGDTQPDSKDHTLMAHENSPGSYWLVRMRVRPLK